MKNKFYYNKSLGNIYLKPSLKSEIVSQILYGEKFTIIKKQKEWLKIKLNFDNYMGYIKNSSFKEKFYPTLKVKNLSAKTFQLKKGRFTRLKQKIFFGSKIMILKKYGNYFEFEKNKWINKKDLIIKGHIEKNYIKILKLFLNTKYLWGGRSADGIDCSALIQIFFFYNNKFFPRDTKDQIKFCKAKRNKKFNKGDIIFWKGHVGICINKNDFLHAYGPRKKVLIMNTLKTVELIEKTANLKVKKITNISKY